jgi:predicted nucleic acid-binding protein
MDERIIDTCTLLNLFASGQPKAIFRHFGGVHVSEHVQGEALWIRAYDHEAPPQLIPQQIDLTECIDDGLLAICRLEHEREFGLFVQLAQQLDDGEASALAIAKVRGWIVATDDRKARRIAAEQSISTISTGEMIHAWSISQGFGDQQTGELLLNIQQFGRFVPRRSDPLYEWWMQLVDSASGRSG